MNDQQKNEIKNELHRWYQAKNICSDKIYEEKKLQRIYTNNFEKNKWDKLEKVNRIFGIRPKIYLWTFGLLFIYIFFLKGCTLFENKHTSENSTFSSSQVKTGYKLYEKPDNESKVLLDNETINEITIIDKTKYYYKVEAKLNNKTITGYINKSFVTK